MNEDNSQRQGRGGLALHLALHALLLGVIGFLALRPGSEAAAQDEQEDEIAGQVAARVDGVDIGHGEALERAAGQLAELEQQRLQCELKADADRHQVIERTVEELVRDRLVAVAAEAAGVDPAAWRQAEADRLQDELTEEEIDAFFSENEDRIRGERADLEPQVRTFLAQQRFVDELKSGHEIEYLLEPYRLEVAPGDGPLRGDAEAPVVIVEWSDFECPFCKRVLPTLDRVLAEYPQEVRLAFRHFPLHAIHPNAQAAAEAAVCAQDQGAFWAMHDLMFKEQDTLSRDDLREKAARLGLDAEAFAACFAAEDTPGRVEADRQAGIALGIGGTPALFVNGRPLVGAVTFEDLAAVVEDELERARD